MANSITRKKAGFSKTSVICYQTSLRYVTKNSLHKYRYETFKDYGKVFGHLSNYWLFKKEYWLSGVNTLSKNLGATSTF